METDSEHTEECNHDWISDSRLEGSHTVYFHKCYKCGKEEHCIADHTSHSSDFEYCMVCGEQISW